MKRKHRSQVKRNVWQKYRYILIFAIGLLIMSYPFLSDLYYRVQQADIIAKFDQKRQEIEPKNIKERMDLAKAYNQTLDPSRLSDPYTDLEKQGVAEYARMLEINEQIGYVEIPSIDVKLSIYAGTTHEVLEKGAGHLEGSSLPVGGENSHTVITAHTGLPSAKLFTDLANVKEQDIFYIHNIHETLAYQVDKIVVVEPDDFSHVLVTPGEDYATLLTCTPYGVNSHRLLVRGKRIPYTKADDVASRKEVQSDDYFVGFVLLLLVLVSLLFYRKKIAMKKRGTRHEK